MRRGIPMLIVDKRGEVSHETSCYISSSDAGPEQLMILAREHWKSGNMHLPSIKISSPYKEKVLYKV